MVTRNSADLPLETATSERVGSERLNLAQKVRLLSGNDMWTTVAAPEIDLRSIRVADGPHGLRMQPYSAKPGDLDPSLPATCFPTAVTLASSWDPALIAEVGAAVAEESVIQGVDVVLGPGLNLKRHPGGGRNFEYFSEDPLLSGVFAAALVNGIQSRGVGACLKHFAANNHEGWRNLANAVIDPRTLHELYLRGFEIAVRRSSPWSVMCGYNQLNDVYCSEHDELLTSILRDRWGFDGVVMSDWGATNDRALGVNAGLDLQMPGCGTVFDSEVLAAVESGKLAEAAIDRSVERLRDLAERTSAPRPAEVSDDAAFEAHRLLARKAAAAGTVLLSNNGVLPLEAPSSVLILGAFGADPRFQGAGSSQVAPTAVTSLVDALRECLGTSAVSFEPVYDPQTGLARPSDLAKAANSAAESSVVIVIVGLPAIYESEGFDRTEFGLPESMVTLIELASTANPNTVVALSNGAPVTMGWADKPGAIVESYLGGQESGGALADVLLGVAEPGGRLAESIPMEVSDLAADANFPGQPRQTQYRENLFVGYRFHTTADVAARFPFGFGQSYTSFEWDEPSVTANAEADGESQFSATDQLTVLVPVRNVGQRSGSDVVQVYREQADGPADRPVRSLIGFAKVSCGPGESVVAEVQLDDRSFEVFDPTGMDWVSAPGRYQLAIGTSSETILHRIEVDILGAKNERNTTVAEGVLNRAARPWAPNTAEFEALLGRTLPVVRPPRPFHRNTALGELEDTFVGPILRRAVIPRVKRELDTAFPGMGEEFLAKFANVVLETPLRTAVALAGGKINLKQMDGLLAVLNREWSVVARTLTLSAARGVATGARKGASGVRGLWRNRG